MISAADQKLLVGFQKKINYEFKNPELLLRALTHKSYSKEQSVGSDRIPHNETLEFLGDSVLSIIASEAIFKKHTFASEGGMTKFRAAFVCHQNLTRAAIAMDLFSYMRVASYMRAAGGIEQSSAIGDCLEAVLGAMYLDGGLEAAQAVAFIFLGSIPEKIEEEQKDAKTELQEFYQRRCADVPTYQLEGLSGPRHEPTFEMSVSIQGKLLARGAGPSKKQAEQDAARNALQAS